MESRSQNLSAPGNTATHNGGVGIHSLPNETIDTICAYLTFESLKNFRLVVKKYDQPSRKYIYQTLVLWGRNDSWHKLSLIAKTPQLAMLVKCIKVARVSPLIEYTRREWWVECIGMFDLPRDSAVYRLTTLEDQNGTGAQKREDYEAYLKWIKAESDLQNSWKIETFPLLGHFRQDLVVETVEESTLATMNTNSLRPRTFPAWRRSNKPLSRRTQQTRIDGEEYRLPENSHFMFFLNTAISTGK